MGDVGKSTRCRPTHLRATESGCIGDVAVDTRKTGLESTQHIAQIFLLQCIRTARVPRSGRNVFGNPPRESGKPLRFFRTVPAQSQS
jgi:hypothetical protein